MILALGGARSLFWCARIIVQDRTKSGFQRTKPRLIRNPLPHAGCGERLPDLFGALRKHRSPVFVESQALFLEWQTEVLEQSAEYQFGISDQILVNDPKHSPRENAIDMRHQSHVIGVILADVTEPEREIIALKLAFET
jgi:hypothetical protein